MAVRIPREKPPATSVPRLTLIPRSSISEMDAVPLRRLKFELVRGSLSSAVEGLGAPIELTLGSERFQTLET